ncbi:hypothetical protein BVG16_23580 [Paenibacillus selenitireducens]|uniref:Uncharacterized protein n=1 Tax=Paenibacillus selenitireducens TaxID=1324314 RepID=A0A1T2X4F6_9BACL|nr:hypothetical protein [Paenibacillus selenitireducens]OPA74737.1 hypothetical protein BVG16_23580 [Paenibacillus selenitireducens]
MISKPSIDAPYLLIYRLLDLPLMGCSDESIFSGASASVAGAFWVGKKGLAIVHKFHLLMQIKVTKCIQL